MAHNLIRRGASPDRAAEELGRAYPEAGLLLTDVDERLLSDKRFPYLRTRPGRKRLQEIRTILGTRRADAPSLPEGLSRVLADAVASGVSAPAVAERLSALTSSEERASFAALDLEELAEALTRRRLHACGAGDAPRPGRGGGDPGRASCQRGPELGRERRHGSSARGDREARGDPPAGCRTDGHRPRLGMRPSAGRRIPQSTRRIPRSRRRGASTSSSRSAAR